MSSSQQAAPSSSSRNRPEFLTQLDRFWNRITEGLELSQLWSQFQAEARASYRLYSKDFRARKPQVESGKKNYFHIAQDFAWALLEKLSPARRVTLLLAILLLIFGGGNYTFHDSSGHIEVIGMPLQFYGGLLLFILLMLEIADRVVMKRDLEIARDIQRWLLPSSAPAVPGVSIAFATRPANTVAGDYYDVFARPSTDSNQSHYLIAVADVAGKSIPAALLMATFQASLKTLSSAAASLPDLVEGMNQYATTNSQGGVRFTTAFLAEFNPTTRVLRYINAGHNPPVLRRASGQVERLTLGGLPLGILADAKYESGEVTLQPGDWLLVFTDGLIEAINQSEEEYGETRMLMVLDSATTDNPADMLSRIMIDVDRFVGPTPQHDDITCLLAKVA